MSQMVCYRKNTAVFIMTILLAMLVMSCRSLIPKPHVRITEGNFRIIGVEYSDRFADRKDETLSFVISYELKFDRNYHVFKPQSCYMIMDGMMYYGFLKETGRGTLDSFDFWSGDRDVCRRIQEERRGFGCRFPMANVSKYNRLTLCCESGCEPGDCPTLCWDMVLPPEVSGE